MSDLKEIGPLQRVLHELQKIRREIDNLEDFILSAVDDDAADHPAAGGSIIDPRTGEQF